MEILIGVFGLAIAVLTFWYTFLRKPKEELEHLKIQFKATQNLSKELQKELEKLMENFDIGHEQIFRNVSYSDYLRELKESYQQNLSDELYQKISKTNLSKNLINSMIKSLENQFSEIQKILIEVRIMNKQAKQKD